MKNLQSIIAWYILKGDVESHSSFIDNFQRQSILWYFKATIDNKTISMNYRKYRGRIVMYRGAHVEIDVFTQKCRHVECRTVKELKEALK